MADDLGGYTCCVEQGKYGHRARKLTWLYVFGVEPEDLPELDWGRSPVGSYSRLDKGFHSKEERAAAADVAVRARLSPKENLATPRAFAELLAGIASLAKPDPAVSDDRPACRLYEPAWRSLRGPSGRRGGT